MAADMLQLQEVVAVCGEFLKGHMDPSNCVGIFQFLEQIACMDMLEFTENYVHVHFLEVRTPGRPPTPALASDSPPTLQNVSSSGVRHRRFQGSVQGPAGEDSKKRGVENRGRVPGIHRHHGLGPPRRSKEEKTYRGGVGTSPLPPAFPTEAVQVHRE